MTEDIHQLSLPGLREDNPRDFLAALGLLRLIDLQWPDLGASLAWDVAQGYPILGTNQELPADWSAQITSSLHELVRDSVKAPKGPLFHGSIIKTSFNAYREAIAEAQLFGEAHPELPFAALPGMLYAAYSDQTPDKDGNVNATSFSMANNPSGKAIFKFIHGYITKLKQDCISTTVLGTAKRCAIKGIRWDPAENRPAAYCAGDPQDEPDVLDFPAKNVLAFIGLSFFPCAPSARKKLVLGIRVNDKSDKFPIFRWATWTSPLSPSVIFSLLGVPDQYATAQSLGLHRYWASFRITDKNKNNYFSSATSS